jgi:hypothetical protein
MADVKFTRTKTEDDGARYYIGGPRDRRPFAIYANDLPNGNGELHIFGTEEGWYERTQLRGGEAWVWTTSHPTMVM